MTKSISGRFEHELSRRVRQFFEDQAQGFDMPPARLYGLEGFIDCGLVCGLIAASDVRQCLVQVAEQVFGEHVADIYRHDERLILHVHMPVAPVFPSTKGS